MKNVKNKLFALFMVIFFLVASGTIIFHWLEDWTWAQSIYFTTTTITTVGFGDIAPTSDGSRLVASGFMLLSVGIAASALTALGSEIIEERQATLDKLHDRISKSNNKLEGISTKAAKKSLKK